VAARVFQGSHWMLHVETEAGPIVVIRQNAGGVVPGEGEAVGLVWSAADMALRAEAPA
jgi:putative spermidine/putrescine transport system ATP-binding protein